MGSKFLKIAFFTTTTIVTFTAGAGVGALAFAMGMVVNRDGAPRSYRSKWSTPKDDQTTTEGSQTASEGAVE